jgi:hypothetical protein
MPQTQWKFSMPPVDSSQLTVKSKLVFQSMKFERNVQTFKVGFKTVKVWLQRFKREKVLLNKKFRCDCFSSDAPRRFQPGAKAMFCPIRTRCSRRFTSALPRALRAVCWGVRCRGGSSMEILSDTALLQLNWNTIYFWKFQIMISISRRLTPSLSAGWWATKQKQSRKKKEAQK